MSRFHARVEGYISQSQSRLIHHAACLVAVCLVVVRASGETVSEKIQARQRAAFSDAHQRSIENRSDYNKPKGGALRQFEDRYGNVTFTNRPEKYQTTKYKEIIPKYDPIVVPKQYTRYKSPTQYTSGPLTHLIHTYAQAYGLDENLVYAVIKAESNFNANAVSNAGARGLMQLMPGTALEMGVSDIFDPAQNIAGGTQYLSKMMELFDNNTSLAVAAYNAGPENVRKYGGIPPFDETQTYVRRVLSYKQQFDGGGSTAKIGELAQVQHSHPVGNIAPKDGKRYMVYFHSGLTQPADKVEDKDPYYYIQFGHQTYPVRKDLVKEIVQPA